MRAVALSVWIFINLVFFGMCGYIYLLWSQYWHYLTRRDQHEQNDLRKVTRPLVDYYQEQMPMEILHMQRQALLKIKPTQAKQKPRFKSNRKELKSNCIQCDSATTKRISAFKNRLIIRLRSVLHDESNVFKTKFDNPYNVDYKGLQKSVNIPALQLICRLSKSVPNIPTITGREKAFSSSALRWSVPNSKLFEDNERYNSCAIVSNSGALKDSKLGKLIDSHDLVLRFNHAPTIGYEEDVGKKTTIRILNSQVVSKKEFNFLKSELYKDIKILVWDPCNYTSTLEQWRDKPDFDVFTPYIKHRKSKPNTNLHLLDPRILWTLWDFIQAHTSVRIRRNPPSSGFLGIALLMPRCDKIRLFEYIPSVRMTPRCHYFDNDVDSSCTFGVWHPLAAEKLISMQLNEEDDYATFQTGFISISGYCKFKC